MTNREAEAHTVLHILVIIGCVAFIYWVQQ